MAKKASKSKSASKKTKSVSRKPRKVTKVAPATPEITKELSEQDKWAQFAREKGVSSSFFRVGNDPTVRRTSDGKSYSTPEEFFADGGAQDFSNVTIVDYCFMLM